jgi:outer membrane murein-binding lipoprotein Lpp
MTCIAKACLAAATLLTLAGCTDEDSIRSEIDDLKAEVGQLHAEVAKASRDAVAAADTSAATADAQKISDAAAQENARAINALSDKIDRMFKRPSPPAAKPCEPDCDPTP